MAFDATGVNVTAATGTLTNTVVAVAADHKRRGVIVSNNSDTVMTLAIGATGTAAVGISVPAGTAISFRDSYVPTAALSLFCAGTAKAYTIYTW
jgi:hypothetical protein